MPRRRWVTHWYVPTSGRLISPTVPEYAVRWHRVDDWIQEALGLSDLVEYRPPHGLFWRLAGWRGDLLEDIWNEEEAYDRAVPLERGRAFEDAPDRKEGGTRRVSIRAFTWTIDKGTRSAYDPQWITTGWGMTARAAVAAHDRYIRNYKAALKDNRASRRLKVAAWEIVFWTANPSADYV